MDIIFITFGVYNNGADPDNRGTTPLDTNSENGYSIQLLLNNGVDKTIRNKIYIIFST